MKNLRSCTTKLRNRGARTISKTIEKKNEKELGELDGRRWFEDDSLALVGRRRCANITRNVAAVAPSVRERSSLAYGPVVPEEHNSSRSITPRAIISSFQKPSPEVFHLRLLVYPSSTMKSVLPPVVAREHESSWWVYASRVSVAAWGCTL